MRHQVPTLDQINAANKGVRSPKSTCLDVLEGAVARTRLQDYRKVLVYFESAGDTDVLRFFEESVRLVSAGNGVLSFIGNRALKNSQSVSLLQCLNVIYASLQIAQANDPSDYIEEIASEMSTFIDNSDKEIWSYYENVAHVAAYGRC